MLLWEILRDVRLWVDTPAEARDGLFAPEAGSRRRTLIAAAEVPPVLAAPIRSIGRLLECADAISAEEIAAACAAVESWAEDRGALETALAFAQSRALLCPFQPETALAVARLAQRAGDHALAELWYRRAAGIARRARAWKVYSHAFSGLGTLYRERGNLPSAHRYHLRALRGARRGGMGTEAAIALHDLFGVAVEAGRKREARRYAREALAAYPRRSPRRAALAHDIAYLWMEEGDFARAEQIFRRVLPLMQHPVERLWVAADLVRAAAGSGNEPVALRMAERVRRACEQPELASAAARALLEVAHGELQLRRWEAAAATARSALELARARREGRVMLAAEAVVEAAERRRTVVARQASPFAGPSPRRRKADDDTLAGELILSLRELAGGSSGEMGIEAFEESTLMSLPPAEAGTL